MNLHPKSSEELEHVLINNGIEVVSEPIFFSRDEIRKIIKLKDRLGLLDAKKKEYPEKEEELNNEMKHATKDLEKLGINSLNDLVIPFRGAESSSGRYPLNDLIGKSGVYNPTYIRARVSDRFTNQQDYLNRARHIISSTAKTIANARHKNAREVFFQILGFLSLKRHAIARLHQTEDADEFGLRRDLRESHFIHTLFLGGDPYTECGESIAVWLKQGFSKIANQVPDLPLTRKGTYQQQVDCLGYKSRLLFEICDIPDFSKWRNVKKVIISKCFSGEIKNSLLDALNKGRAFSEEERKMFKGAVLLCCKEDLEIRNNVDMLAVLKRINAKKEELEVLDSWPPHPEYYGFMLRATASISMNGTMQPLTTYNALIYMKENSKLDYSNPICKVRCLFLLHQPPELIQTTLECAVEVFQKIMDWDGNDLNALQEQMGLLTYLLVHNMRDVRGSAAETEWFTYAIYEALDVFVTTNEAYLQDLEAFSHPLLSEFIDRYKMLYSLRHKEPTG
ncbi:MAG: hypothetical protein V4489_04760 [Chlamydiota bacterium]